MNRKLFLYVIFGGLILGAIVGRLSSCGGTPSEQGNWAPLEYENNPHSAKYDFSEVDAAAVRLVSGHPDVDGLTLAIVREGEGQIYEEGYGEFGRDRISFIASTTKVLSAGVILALVDDGLLELDRPVSEYLEWGDYHPGVTVELLLSMMSGLPAFPEDLADREEQCAYDPATTLRECAKEVFQDESQSIPPGQEFRYGANAWVLAGGVAEVVSGKSWAQLVQEKLVVPCGLPNTGYVNGGYRVDYPAEDPADIPPSENPMIGGGAYSTVNDYSKILLMHLNGGICGEAKPERVLSPDMVQRMQQALVPEGVAFPPPIRPQTLNYGMGWWWWEEDPPLLVDSGAFGAMAILHPDEGWGAIMVIEANGLLGAVMYYALVPLIREAVMKADQN